MTVAQLAPATDGRHASRTMALCGQVLLVTALAWGAFAFGAVYPWAYWPLVAAAITIGVAGLAIRAGGSATPLGLTGLIPAFALFLVTGLLQLLPIPLTLLTSISPESPRVISQLNLAVAAGLVSRHPLSIAPALTQTSLILIASFALLVLGGTRLFSIRGARGVAEALACVGVALALAGIIQQRLFNGKIYGLWTPYEAGDSFGPFVNKNHFAGWMLMALPLTLGLLWGGVARGMRGVKPNLRNRLLWLSSRDASRVVLLVVGSIVMALSLVMTMSRSGMGALALALVITGGFVACRQLPGRRAVALAYLLVLVVVVVGWAGADAIASRFTQTDWSDLNGRRGAWDDAIGIASRFPVAGTGLNTYGVATLFFQRHDLEHHYAQAHNDYLQLRAEGGLLLTIPAVLCAVVFIVVVRRRFIEETSTGSYSYWLRLGAVTGLMAIALQETVEFSLQMPGNAALFAVLCAIALHRAPARTSVALREERWRGVQ